MPTPEPTAQCLPPAPPQVVHQGQPATGRYCGNPQHIDWSGLDGRFQRSRWWQGLHHKRWHYLGLATEECFIGLAIVDLGWTNTAFVYVFDRQSKQLLVDYAQDGLPGLTAHVGDQPADGAASWFRHLGCALRFAHVGGTRYHLSAKLRQHVWIEAEVDTQGCAPFLTAIGPVGNGGCAHSTVKSSALAVSGSAFAHGKTFDLTRGVASFDYSNGLLARHTEWRWASAHAPGLGFNLQQGYFGSHENVLWLDGALIPLGAAQFDFDPTRPLHPWHIYTDDGLLDLWFHPEGARQARKNLWVAASYYIQPIGCFTGTVRASVSGPGREVQDLLGVTEDHQSRW